ncbi:7-deoxyloganetin glucosyltransferase [Bienertia sinuspersici]
MQQLPPIYSIGPFELLTHQIIPKYNNSNNLITSINSSLWKEESGWKEWLDSKEPQSVVYVNFGSITTLTQEQFMEFACGLANSKKHFLWVIRPDLVKNSKYDAPILPQEFVTETKERGMLAIGGCVEWGIGMEIGSEVKRGEVEKLLRELMDGKEGMEMKKRAMDWKNEAEVAVALGVPLTKT